MDGKKGNVVMHKYELGRILGQGTFGKVYRAKNLATGESVAVKVIDKEKVLQVGMIQQIKREISGMRLVRHPNVVHLHEVMASKSKIYIVMEYIRGGELFSMVAKGKLKEDVARKYFQQLVCAVDFCHSRGVYHRDLKPENLLLDERGNLKVSDFGLSTLGESRQPDGLLHTACGTPAYVAPEVINKKGYDGAKADIWSCGVVLFVLMAGYLPFRNNNLIDMYRKITRGDFNCPQWFSSDARRLITRIMDPNPNTRITVAQIMDTVWFKKGFKPPDIEPRSPMHGLNSHHLKSDDEIVDTVFKVGDDHREKEDALEEQHNRNNSISNDTVASASSSTKSTVRPPCLNAFDIISQSRGFDLSRLFEEEGSSWRPEGTFMTRQPAEVIVSRLERVAGAGGEHQFKVRKTTDGQVKLEGRIPGRKGKLEIDTEIFEVTPALFVVEVKKAAGDTVEYQNFCNQQLRPSLQDIVSSWLSGDDQLQQQPFPTSSTARPRNKKGLPPLPPRP